MNSRPRRALTWIKRMLSGPVRRPAPYRAKLEVLFLEDRISPAVFNPAPLAADGAAGSLRAAIITANGNTSVSNTFNLRAGAYTLSLANAGDLQENAAVTGDLDLTGVGKTYIFKGAAQGGTIIDADTIDRVFQILPGVTNVQFVNVTIGHGFVSDDGADGAPYGSTDALGGGILFEGNQLILNRTTILNCQAQGASGNEGGPGQNGGHAFAGFGGAIYSAGGNVTLQNGARLGNNLAVGGRGGNGGNLASGVAGIGGDGGQAYGGGIYLAGGRLTMSASTIYSNRAGGLGQGGGNGGEGDFTHVGGIGGEGGLAQGGGIYANGATLSIARGSVLVQNFALGGIGGHGGEFHDANGGNGGIGQGGGIFAVGGALTMIKSLVTGNTAAGGFGGLGGNGIVDDYGGGGGTGGIGQGGGAYLDVAAPNIKTSIFAANTAKGGDGGKGGVGGDGNSSAAAVTGGPGGEGGAGQGGGLFLGASNLTTKVTQTTLGGNFAFGGDGGEGGLGGTFTAFIDTFPVGGGRPGGDGGQGGAAGGAGAFVDEGTLNLDRSTVSDNLAQGGEGGRGGKGGSVGFASGDGGQGGRGGNAFGGGLLLTHGTITLINSTLANNIAQGGDGGDGGDGGNVGDGGRGGDGGIGQGGGAYIGVFYPRFNFYNSTVAFNEAHAGGAGAGGLGEDGGDSGTDGTGAGGGVFKNGGTLFDTLGEIYAFSTIFSDNLADDSGANFFGFVFADHCLFGSTTDTIFLSDIANLKDVDPLLAELADNGEPTFTIAIASNSPAKNKGSNPLNLKVDQRGQKRTQGTEVDIGAFEVG